MTEKFTIYAVGGRPMLLRCCLTWQLQTLALLSSETCKHKRSRRNGRSRHRRASEGSTGRLPTTPRAPLHAPSTSAATARKETDPDLIPIPTPRTRGDAQPAMALQVTGALFVGRQAACSNGVVLIQWCSLQ